MATTPEPNEPAPSVPPPPPQSRLVLQPGQLSKPEKVWASSSAFIIGFYQAAPYSEAFKIFYKKSGAVFGTQVMLTPASILGPELAVRQPVQGEVQYFEYEIKKLKPSTQYVVKIKTSDGASEVRSDKMVTISREEEGARDNDMRSFVGALVKLGDYDGLVVSYAVSSGIYGIRILQIDDVANSLQMARVTSDYTDNGVPVQACTLSQVRFGRWGGAITGSKVVNEGELKWLVARAVQMGDKSDAAAAFEARQRMLQAQVERVTMSLEVEWSNRFRSLRIRSLSLLAILLLVAVGAGAGMGLMLGAAGQRQRDLELRLAASGVRQTELEAELQILHLYRVSLELDVERRLALSNSGSGSGSRRSNHNEHSYYGNRGAGCSNSSGGGGEANGNTGVVEGGGLLDLYMAATAIQNGSDAADDSRGSGRIPDVTSSTMASSESHKRRRGDKGILNGKHAQRGTEGSRAGGGGGDGGGHTARSVKSRDGRGARHCMAGSCGHGHDGISNSKSSRNGGRRKLGGLQDDGRHRSRDGDGKKSTRDAAAGRDRTLNGCSGGREGIAVKGMYEGSSRGRGGGAADLWGLPNQALMAALERSRSARLHAEGRRVSAAGGGWSREWLSAGDDGSNGGPAVKPRSARDYDDSEAAAEVEDSADEAQPDAWAFIHYVSHVYALHLQEWMKVQLQKNVRQKVNEMLLPSRADGTAQGVGSDADESEEAYDSVDVNSHSTDGPEEEWDEYRNTCAGKSGGYDDEYDQYDEYDER